MNEGALVAFDAMCSKYPGRWTLRRVWSARPLRERDELEVRCVIGDRFGVARIGDTDLAVHGFMAIGRAIDMVAQGMSPARDM